MGIGGPVGSGKTTLLEMLCKGMRDQYDLVAITNDIYTKEDQRLLTDSGALPAERIMGVETGGCPHTAIREDASINLEAIDRMLEKFPNADIVFIESGGDNLTSLRESRPGRDESRHHPHAHHRQRPQAVCHDQFEDPGGAGRGNFLHRIKRHVASQLESWAWKLGRVVDCTGLENRQTERFLGFESLSFRQYITLSY